MDSLPLHLLNEILLRADLSSLAMMRSTNRSLRSLISNDPYFKSKYFSQLRSGLLHMATGGSSMLYHHSFGDPRSPRTKDNLMECRILASCSGLLLLYLNGQSLLCVANPFTKKFLFLNHIPRSRTMDSRDPYLNRGDRMYIGFAVDHIDRTTQSFKIVSMKEEHRSHNLWVYEFLINTGGSWGLPKRVTCYPSELDYRMKNPIYLNGSLHWLRKDGSIIVFKPETEEARLIQFKFPEKLSLKTLFASDDKNLVLISATEDVIKVYALENSFTTDPKWVLSRRIRNGVLDKNIRNRWNVEAYDGKYLVLRDYSKDQMVHGYDMTANKWGLMGPGRFYPTLDFFLFTPSSSYVIGLDQNDDDMVLHSDDDDKRFSSLSSIMELAIGGLDKFISPEEHVSFG
ncbi:putative F-box protein [Cardamine amara subsp. amara]|uniref:F-box protein n=1 Tax=Cardamine amara subsp. amara TaxID=228776 RepID=A0ABD1C3A9_CARAN